MKSKQLVKNCEEYIPFLQLKLNSGNSDCKQLLLLLQTHIKDKYTSLLTTWNKESEKINKYLLQNNYKDLKLMKETRDDMTNHYKQIQEILSMLNSLFTVLLIIHISLLELFQIPKCYWFNEYELSE